MSHTDFNFGWRFSLSNPPQAFDKGFDDGDWRELRLPHDWSTEAAYDERLEGATAFLPGGVGWYRKRFSWTPDEHLYFLYFDGIYNNATVWLNGHELGFHPYGYTPFYVDITPYLEAENVVAVKVDRNSYADSRWYTGSGIYRDVSLVRKPKLHIPIWGSFITTPQVSEKEAAVRLELKVTNCFSHPAEARLTTRILDANEQTVAKAQTSLSLEADSEGGLEQSFEVIAPKLWSPDTPYLYSAVSELEYQGEVVETYETPFGIRSFTFDAENGFSLNSVKTLIKGVCLHHDAGLVGAAVPDAVWRRRLETLKEAGCNAVRISHNPASKAFLNLCDELGFLVQEEFFDDWDFPKDKRFNKKEVTPDPITEGYTKHFHTWAEHDLKATVLRDRNHPSIIQWSIGNEIEWTYDRYAYATGYFEPSWEGNYFFQLPPFSPAEIRERFFAEPEEGYSLAETAQRLSRWTKELDTTRPVVANCILPSVSHLSGYADALDVVGYSYRRVLYDYALEHYPDKPVMGTENLGQWHEWKAVLERPFVAGIFLWTGIDYLGEAHDKWPAKSLHTGLLDLAGFKKPSFHMFKTLWRSEPHIFICTQTLKASLYTLDKGKLVARNPGGWQRALWVWQDVNEHWNYAEGQRVVVEVYSNCETLELTLNGQSLGRKRLSDFEDRIYKWTLPFAAGELCVQGEHSGKLIQQSLFTASEPVHINLRADKSELQPDGYDCAHITAQLEDASGRPVRHLERDIEFEVEGDCRVLGVDNGVAGLESH